MHSARLRAANRSLDLIVEPRLMAELERRGRFLRQLREKRVEQRGDPSSNSVAVENSSAPELAAQRAGHVASMRG